MQVTVVNSIRCPKCGAPEVNPTTPDKVLIRAFKVFEKNKQWSQCLVCAGFVAQELSDDFTFTYRSTPDLGDRAKGWFATRY